MPRAIFPGSFDPPTFGHVDVIERASKIFSSIHLVIAENVEKTCLFSAAERLELCRQIARPFPNLEVAVWDGLVVDYARQVGAAVILRGVRNSADFSYEFDLALLNRSLAAGVETLLIPSDPRNFVVRSTAIRDLARRNADVSRFVPPVVAAALKRKFAAK